ncbi:hypothetical protein HOO65_011377 [Ceratocystis lukuohia]|uniref:Nephrocystin 3-like N-terminal domain-containing protein n=1 Tax=Ceratocystis lukuohia TaxID=2019550 RepID=A0ABR4MUS8_9PEZI
MVTRPSRRSTKVYSSRPRSPPYRASRRPQHAQGDYDDTQLRQRRRRDWYSSNRRPVAYDSYDESDYYPRVELQSAGRNYVDDERRPPGRMWRAAHLEDGGSETSVGQRSLPSISRTANVKKSTATPGDISYSKRAEKPDAGRPGRKGMSFAHPRREKASRSQSPTAPLVMASSGKYVTHLSLSRSASRAVYMEENEHSSTEDFFEKIHGIDSSLEVSGKAGKMKMMTETEDIVKRLQAKYRDLVELLDEQDEELASLLEEKETEKEAASIDLEMTSDKGKLEAKMKRLMGRFKMHPAKSSPTPLNPENPALDPCELNGSEPQKATEKDKDSKLEKIRSCAVSMTQYLAGTLNTSAPYVGLGAALLLQALIHVVEIPSKVNDIFIRCRQCIESIQLAGNRDVGELNMMLRDVGTDIFNSTLLYAYMETIIEVWKTLSQYAISWVRKLKIGVDQALGTDDQLQVLLDKLDAAEKATYSDMMFKSAVISARYMGILKEGLTRLTTEMRQMHGSVNQLTELFGERQAVDRKLAMALGFTSRETVDWYPTPESLGTLPPKDVRSSCQWVFEVEEVERLIADDNTDSPYILHLHGLKGTGKTTALLSLRDFIAGQRGDHVAWSAVSFFHQTCDADLAFDQSCFRSLAWQFIKQNSDLEHAILGAFSEANSQSSPVSLAWASDLHPALMSARQDSDDHVLILIDCDKQDHKSLVEAIANCSRIPGFHFVIATQHQQEEYPHNYKRTLVSVEDSRVVKVTKHTEADAHKAIRNFLNELVKTHHPPGPLTPDTLAEYEERLRLLFQHSGRSFSALNDYMNTLRKSSSMAIDKLGADVQSSAWAVSQQTQQETIKKLSPDERQELSLILAWLRFGLMPLRIQALSLLSDITLFSSGSHWTKMVRERINNKYSYFVQVDSHGIVGWQPDFNPEFLLREESTTGQPGSTSQAPLDPGVEDVYVRVLKALFPLDGDFERLGLKQALEDRKGIVLVLNDDNDQLLLAIACLRILVDMHHTTDSFDTSAVHNPAFEPLPSASKVDSGTRNELKSYWADALALAQDPNATNSVSSQSSSYKQPASTDQEISVTSMPLAEEDSMSTDRYDQDDICYMTTYAIACLVPHIRSIKNIQDCDIKLKEELARLLPKFIGDPAAGYAELGATSPKASSHYWYKTHVKALLSHAELSLRYDNGPGVLGGLLKDETIKDAFRADGRDLEGLTGVHSDDEEASEYSRQPELTRVKWSRFSPARDSSRSRSPDNRRTGRSYRAQARNVSLSPEFRRSSSSGSRSTSSVDDRVSRARGYDSNSDSEQSQAESLDVKGMAKLYAEPDWPFNWMLQKLFLGFDGARRHLVAGVAYAWNVYDRFKPESDRTSSLAKLRAHTLTLTEFINFEDWARSVVSFDELSASEKNRYLMSAVTILSVFCRTTVEPRTQFLLPTRDLDVDARANGSVDDELAIPQSKYQRLDGYPGHHHNEAIDQYNLALLKLTQEAKSLRGVVPYWLLSYVKETSTVRDYLVDHLVRDAVLSARYKRSQVDSSGDHVTYDDSVKPDLECPSRIIADTLVHLITEEVTNSIARCDETMDDALLKDIKLWTRLAVHNDSTISTVRSLLLLHNSVYTMDIYAELLKAMQTATEDWRILSQDYVLSMIADPDLYKILQHLTVNSTLSTYFLPIFNTIKSEIFSKNNIYSANLKHIVIIAFNNLFTFRFPNASNIQESLSCVDNLLNNTYYGTQSLTDWQRHYLHLHKFTLTYLANLGSSSDLFEALGPVMSAAKANLSRGKIGNIVRNSCFQLWTHASTRHPNEPRLLELLENSLKVYQERPYSRSDIRRVAKMLTAIGDSRFSPNAWRLLAALDYYEYVPSGEPLTIKYTRDRLRGHSLAYQDFMHSQTWPVTAPWPIDIEDFKVKLPEILAETWPSVDHDREEESIRYLKSQRISKQDRVDLSKRWADYMNLWLSVDHIGGSSGRSSRSEWVGEALGMLRDNPEEFVGGLEKLSFDSLFAANSEGLQVAPHIRGLNSEASKLTIPSKSNSSNLGDSDPIEIPTPEARPLDLQNTVTPLVDPLPSAVIANSPKVFATDAKAPNESLLPLADQSGRNEALKEAEGKSRGKSKEKEKEREKVGGKMKAEVKLFLNKFK